MPKLTVYDIRLAPEDGVTLYGRTKQEWDLGYTFRVLWSDYVAIRMNHRVTEVDLRALEAQYGIKFNVEFDVQSVEENLETLAEDCYASEMTLQETYKLGGGS